MPIALTLAVAGVLAGAAPDSGSLESVPGIHFATFPLPAGSPLTELEIKLAEETGETDFGDDGVLEFDGVAPAQGTVLGGIGLDLTPVQADLAQLEKSQRLGQQQDLYKQRLELLQKTLAKRGQGVVIRVCIGGNVAKGNRVVGGLFQLPAREHGAARAGRPSTPRSGAR